jgi:hypothetical protein
LPNVISNALSVCGTPEGVNAFVSAAYGRMPQTGNKLKRGEKRAERPIEELCFHALVPLPDAYSKVPYSLPQETGDGKSMEWDTWGVKWGAYGVDGPEHDSGVVSYRFNTAWYAPHVVFLPKVAQRFPELLFLLSWGGEGPTRGRAWFWGAKSAAREEPYCEKDYPAPNADDENKPGAWDEFERATYARRRTHPLWVGLTLAELAGHPFDPKSAPGPVLADWLQEQGWEKLAAEVRELDAAEPVGRCPTRRPKKPSNRKRSVARKKSR